ncbi:MAG: Gfo/Idh/MocA family oxidoreductase [Niabella sp.]
MNSRRDFIRRTTVLGAGAFISADLLAMKSAVSPNNKIGVGVIGCKGQGWSNLNALLKVPEVQCVALCDIDDNILSQRMGDLQKLNIKPKTYTDYRKMLTDKDVDVVVIATPDHWHCLQLVDALSAGKDVFCEKPVSNSVYEAQLMNKAVQRYDRIVQVAQWQRSQQHFKDAIAFVHSGKLGKISSTKAWMYRGGTQPLPVVTNSPVPAGVNYDMWLGPAKKRPFNKNRFHYEFRWFWDYAGGLMTDWGVHLIDMVLMGMKAGTPKSVMATGGKYVFPGDARETPDIQTALYDFGDFQMSWEHNMATGMGLYGMQHGIAFIGDNGTLLLNRGGWEVRGEKDKLESVPWTKVVDRGLDLHAANFIDVVKSRKKEELNCPFDAGAKVAVVSHFGNIAVRTGEKIYWDEAKNKFSVDKATRLVKPVYNNGWKLPVV